MKLIDADDAIRWIKIECNPYAKPTLDFESGKKVIAYLERLPSVQPERMRGKWIAYDRNVYMCSCCGRRIITNPDYIKEQKFCFRCGADMRGGQDETD